ncbi:MAG: LuxR C-terminal-related transcriptional regulator [Acidimicrobiales bacterium]|jgi:DNA-binding NarL/FixJ family response regulator
MTRTPATSLRGDQAAIPTVVVCDDRDVMRLGLVEMLDAIRCAADLKGFTSVPDGWAYLADSSAAGAVAILGGNSAPFELERAGRPSRPPTRIVLMLRDSEATRLSVAAGLPVDGFFLEEDLSTSMLRTLLSRLENREFPMPAPMAEFLLGQVRGSSDSSPVRLSSREQAVLRLVADGATNKIIADELGISVHGVKHHVANLLKQLNCANRTEVASMAMRRGLVPAEPARSAGHVLQGLSGRHGAASHRSRQ